MIAADVDLRRQIAGPVLSERFRSVLGELAEDRRHADVIEIAPPDRHHVLLEIPHALVESKRIDALGVLSLCDSQRAMEQVFGALLAPTKSAGLALGMYGCGGSRAQLDLVEFTLVKAYLDRNFATGTI